MFIYHTDLAGLSIASPLDLVSTSLGEADAEEPQSVAICGFKINMSLDQSLPFLNQWPEFVGCEVHAPELAQNIPSLDIFGSETDLPVRAVFILFKISKRNLENSVFQAFWGNLVCSERHMTRLDIASKDHHQSQTDHTFHCSIQLSDIQLYQSIIHRTISDSTS